PIPDAIGNLSLLNTLYLYSNKLEGHIPSSLGNCKELNGLNLAYNRLNHVIDVIDNDAIVLQSTEADAKKVEECLVATIKIGVSCSVDSPPQRMKTEIVVTELQSLIPSLLGEVESNCNKEQFMSLLNKRYVVKHVWFNSLVAKV
ncbi:kinase-like domain-containing protein, partial [Tanacetum coccineum]